MDELITAAAAQFRARPELKEAANPTLDQRYQPIAKLNEKLGGMPVFGGNKVELLPDYDGAIARIAAEIDQAERFVHVEYFALSKDDGTDPVFQAMARAQERGVKVRVLMDYMGSRVYKGYKDTRAWLEAQHIEAHAMLPVNLFDREFSRVDLRNHRKIVVIDGHIGFTGSQNMIRRNYFRKDDIYYDELVARLEGPSVAELEAIFITDWYAESGVLLSPDQFPELKLDPKPVGDVLVQAVPSGPGHEDENNLKLFTSLIHTAHDKLVLTNPYFVPDDSLLTAITSAAQRGVDVTLINSEAADQFLVYHAQHSFYHQLLKSGVKIYWYKRPVLLHSKFMTIDDDIAAIGSSNLDMRSFQLDLEVSMVYYDRGVVAACRQIEADYLTRSRAIHTAEWDARPTTTRLAENLARLTSALQ
jgi:cardiolipin synthase